MKAPRKILLTLILTIGSIANAGGDVSSSPAPYPRGIAPKDFQVILSSSEIKSFFASHHVESILAGTVFATTACIGNSPVVYDLVLGRTEDRAPCHIRVWVGPTMRFCTTQSDLRVAHIESGGSCN
jgi:hypothetical protein